MMVRGVSRAFRTARMTWRRLWRDESGSVMSFLVVVPVLMGAVAVGVETGELYRTKRQMQSAADDAALAGSIDRLAGKNNTTITATARYEAQRNGFQDGVNSVSVTVNAPPTSGSNVSTAGAVEVVITKPQSLTFGAALNFTMRARSVAAQGSYSSTTSSPEGCLVALTSANEQGVSFTSFNNFDSDCTIISNGTATGTGANASVSLSSFNNATLKSVWTRGRFDYSSYNHLTLTNPAQQNQTTAVVDPYATGTTSLPTPSPGACTYNPFSAPGGTSITLSPGVYCGGLTISSYNNVYFTHGIYYIANGDLYMSSVNNVSCSDCTSGAGVTFVLTQTTGNNADIGGVRISSDNNVTFNAPVPCSVSNPPANCINNPLYPGVLFYQDRRATTGTMTSTSKIFTISSLNTATLTGAIYFPNNRIDISSLNNSGSSTTGCTVWIGRYVKFSSYNNNYIAGCDAIGTSRPAIITTTTTNKSKVFE
jgi:Flp pilus assembly protein TadG